jgi:hypothetical protein
MAWEAVSSAICVAGLLNAEADNCHRIEAFATHSSTVLAHTSATRSRVRMTSTTGRGGLIGVHDYRQGSGSCQRPTPLARLKPGRHHGGSCWPLNAVDRSALFARLLVVVLRCYNQPASRTHRPRRRFAVPVCTSPAAVGAASHSFRAVTAAGYGPTALKGCDRQGQRRTVAEENSLNGCPRMTASGSSSKCKTICSIVRTSSPSASRLRGVAPQAAPTHFGLEHGPGFAGSDPCSRALLQRIGLEFVVWQPLTGCVL